MMTGKKRTRVFRKETMLLMLLFLAFVLLQAMLQMSGRIQGLGVYKGVFTSLQFGVCLLMMLVDLKRGTRFAISLMVLSVLFMAFVIMRGGKDAVPGLCNAVFYIITIIVISRYDMKREIESRTDPITGAYNRKGLYLELEEKIINNTEFGIVYINLNNFKSINDVYGHAYGDELLRKISGRIQGKFGKGCSVARVGGAEFVVAVSHDSDIKQTADILLDAFREKTVIAVDGNTVDCYIEGYAGISRFPEDTSDYESLIKYADIAMTEAVAKKSKEACLFSAEMLEQIDRRIRVKALIKEGLQNDYFYLVYQPQYDLNKNLRGFETLLRMKTSDGEMVSPAEFIPVAEMSDLILQIDDYVLTRAMNEFKDIIGRNPALTLSVNVSAKNFSEPDFSSKIKRCLELTGFCAKNLEVEITEYCMVNSIDTTTDNINALRKLGVQVALDDFGTGYTALNYVASLPIDLLKIDKSLIDDIENDDKRRDFIKAIITMGQLMDCEIMAEGAENEEQTKCLKQDGCNYVQGFVWGKPLEYDAAASLALR